MWQRQKYKTKLVILGLMMCLTLVFKPFDKTAPISQGDVAQLYIGTTSSVVKGPSQMTFHGFLEEHQVDGPPKQHAVVAHVLMKVKRLASGSFVIRAVCFMERVSLPSG